MENRLSIFFTLRRFREQNEETSDEKKKLKNNTATKSYPFSIKINKSPDFFLEKHNKKSYNNNNKQCGRNETMKKTCTTKLQP